jgi:microcin C transport system substrate-binding protein
MTHEFRFLSRPTRRGALALGVFAGISTLLPRHPLTAQEAAELGPSSHGLSIFGDLKYPADFKHFAYVNPQAPKGGEIALQVSSTAGNQNFTTFNTLNIYSQRGDGAAGMGLIFDSLMAGSSDEEDALYGLVAQSVRRSADGQVYRFQLRPEARFHDGSPITAEDVVFTIETLKSTRAYATYRLILQKVTGASALSPQEVEIRFAPDRSRELPLIVAGLPIFSKAYYASRDFDSATLESPLGSGSYRVDRIEQGRSISFRRVPDYWGKDLPVAVGQANFDVVRYEYFRDREAAFQAFTAGVYTFRDEFTSVIWSTRYDFPAIREGRVKRDTAVDGRPSGTQGWFLNTRRPQFRDPRVREAIGLAFDFEWMNQNLMYGLYKRTTSFFENSPLKAAGKPGPEELALLEPFRGKVPDEVFGEPHVPPVSDGSGQDRTLLRQAQQLLQQAGAKRGDDGILRLADGTRLTLEFLEFDGGLTKHVEAFGKNLRLLGIGFSIRQVDPSQYQRRVQDYDYDVVSARFVMSLTPGETLNTLFGSQAARTPSSRNLAGIADPSVDAMIGKVIAAKSKADITHAARALDRLLRAGRYWVPAWYAAEHKFAYWDMYTAPGPIPPLAGGASTTALATWWYDADKAKRIGK